MNDRERAVKETYREQFEGRDINRDILKYRKERAKILENSITLMDGSILENQTYEPDGGLTQKQDSVDE